MSIESLETRSINVADLKRLPVGLRLRMVWHAIYGACDKLRVVTKVTSVGLQFTGDGIAEARTSHLSFPKARDLAGDQSGFVVSEDGTPCMKYIVENWPENRLF